MQIKQQFFNEKEKKEKEAGYNLVKFKKWAHASDRESYW